MIVANKPCTLINCTCNNRLCFSLLPFTLIPQYLKRFNWSKQAKTNKIWIENREIHSAFACVLWPPWFPDLSRPYGACVKRGSGKHMFGLSLFRPSRQSNISTSGEERFKYPLPWENKISQMPYTRANKDDQIPTPCPAFPHRHDIDRCIKRICTCKGFRWKNSWSTWGYILTEVTDNNNIFH